MALNPEAVDNTEDDFAVVAPASKNLPRVKVQQPDLSGDDDFSVVDNDQDFEVEKTEQPQAAQTTTALKLPTIPAPKLPEAPKKPSLTEQLSERLDNYSKAAALQISELYDIPSQDAMSMMTKLKEDTRKQYEEELAGKLDSQEEYDRGYTSKFQENIGEVISQGTKMQMMGGPNAFLEGRKNVEARKAARESALKDFDVNFISRASASGILQTAGGFTDFGATLAKLVGADSASKYLTDKGKALAELNSYIPFKVQGTEDIQNVWDVGALASKASIEMAPQLAVSYLAGGLAARGATALRGGAALSEKGMNIARGVGSFAVNTALETGGNARDQMDTNNMLDPKMALLGGVASGGLETLSDVVLFKKLWPLLGVHERELLMKDLAGKTTKEVLKQIGKHTGKAVLQQVPVEAFTEAAQEGISIGTVELSRKDPKFFQSPELDEKKFSEYTKRILNAGVYGGLGAVGLTGVMTGAQGALVASQSAKMYEKIKQASQDAAKAEALKREFVQTAAKNAEKAKAPQTAKALLEFNDLGTLSEKEEPEQKQEKPEQKQEKPEPQPGKPEEEQTQPRAGGELREFQLTDKVFKSQEEAEKFILSQKNPGDFEMMDNSDVDDEGEILPEFIILKREGTEISEPSQKENSEEGPTQEALAEQTPEPFEKAGPETTTPQEQVAPQPTPVQPEVTQQGEEAIPAPVVEPSATTPDVKYIRNPNASRHRTDPLKGDQPVRVRMGPEEMPSGTRGRLGLIAYEKFLNKQSLSGVEVQALIKWSEDEGIEIPFTQDPGTADQASSNPSWVLDTETDTWNNKTDKPTNKKLVRYNPKDGGQLRYDLLPEGVTPPKEGDTTFGKLGLTPENTEKEIPEKSPGHVGFYEYEGTTYELYKDAKGDLFRAPTSNVFDANTGYRIGRWEAPAEKADAQAARILGTQKTEALETDQNVLNASQADFLRSVVAVLGEDSQEARKTAADLLLARFQRASQRAEYDEAKS